MDGFSDNARYYEAVSLCVKNDSTDWWRQWTRVADIIDGQLCVCSFDDSWQESSSEQKYAFENRYALPHKVRQHFDKGSLAVFSWSDAPDPERPDKIKTSITLLSQLPIQVIPLHANTAKQAVELLHGGVSEGSLNCDVLYLLEPMGVGTQQGLYCQTANMEFKNGLFRLKLSVSKLPYYNLEKDDMLTIQELRKYPELSSYTFLKKRNLGVPAGTVPAKDALAVVRDRILSHQKMTWPSFRDFTSRTNNELKAFKEFLKYVTGKDLYQEIADDIGCSLETAQKYVEDFVANANEYLDGTEIDTGILSRLVEANDTMRSAYMRQIEDRWKREAAKRLEQAGKELQQIKHEQEKCARTLDGTKHQLALAEKHLEEIQETIRENERIAQDSYRFVQDKLAHAKSNVAEFLADMSLYLPVPTSGAGSGSNVATFLRGTKLDVDVVDSVDDFQSVIDGLADNLSSCAGITKDHSHHLHMARFLYATYLRRQPLLLAGLNAEEIVQILSATVRGQYADVLTCTESYDEKTAAESMKGEGILLVRNSFSGNWLQNLLRHKKDCHKQIIICHPYTEDLSIEPESLFQYFMPIFTTDFVEREAEMSGVMGTILVRGGKAFSSSPKPGLRRDWLDCLRISRMMQRKMQGILSDVTGMAEPEAMDNTVVAFEYVLLSYAAVTGKGEQLCKQIQDSNSLPPEIKTYVYDFFDYEEK